MVGKTHVAGEKNWFLYKCYTKLKSIYFSNETHIHAPSHLRTLIPNCSPLFHSLHGSISWCESGSSSGLSHWKKVKQPSRMAITPLKWYHQWNMIDQLNSIAQKNVGLSRVLYAQWVEAWCSFQVHFASLLCWRIRQSIAALHIIYHRWLAQERT